MISSRKPYWTPGELIIIGTFAGLIKASTMLIAMAGGGMNPVTLVLKNVVATSLLIILVYKVNKFGVLTLFSIISSIVSLLLMGGNPMSVAGTIVAGPVCDVAMAVTGSRQNTFVLIMGVALFDLLSRMISLGYSYFMYRENLNLFIMGSIVVALGYRSEDIIGNKRYFNQMVAFPEFGVDGVNRLIAADTDSCVHLSARIHAEPSCQPGINTPFGGIIGDVFDPGVGFEAGDPDRIF